MSSATKPECLISVFVIVHDGEMGLESFAREALAFLSSRFHYYELVLLDNHTGPHTQALIARLLTDLPHIRVVRFSRELSIEIAQAAGLDHSIGDFVVTLDLRSDPVTILPVVLDLLLQDNDVLIGQYRATRGGLVRRWISRFGRAAARRILQFDLPPRTGQLFGLSRRAVNSITRIRSNTRNLIYDTKLVGFQQVVLPYDLVPTGQKSRYHQPLLNQIGNFTNLIVMGSVFPLRLASAMGIAGSLLNLMYLVYIACVAFFKRGIVEGWLTTSLTHTVMFLLMFVILIVLAEYIGRILNETREQPLYFVEAESNSTIHTFDRQRLNIV